MTNTTGSERNDESTDIDLSEISITATEPAWVEQQHKVTQDGVLEPTGAPKTEHCIDDLMPESTYEVDTGEYTVTLNSFSNLNNFIEAIQHGKADEFIEAVGAEKTYEE